MKTRILGQNLAVSELGYGAMGLSFGYGPPTDRQQAIAVLRAAVERGVTFFDTAQVYGPFANEELLGEALEPFRGQVVIATKFGWNIDPETDLLRRRRRCLHERPARVLGRAHGRARGQDGTEVRVRATGT